MDISKHDTAVTAGRPAPPGQNARLYRFPSRAQVILPQPRMTVRPRTWFRTHLMLEIALGLIVWLLWFVWHLMN